MIFLQHWHWTHTFPSISSLSTSTGEGTGVMFMTTTMVTTAIRTQSGLKMFIWRMLDMTTKFPVHSKCLAYIWEICIAINWNSQLLPLQTTSMKMT